MLSAEIWHRFSHRQQRESNIVHCRRAKRVDRCPCLSTLSCDSVELEAFNTYEVQE